MLTRLSIQNYALIDDLSVTFSTGFTTITGETGAGKSILLESLSLVLGKRADRTALRDHDRKCVIEAEFSLQKYPALRDFFTSADLEYDPQTILRREVHPSGKSRAFVNDSPVTLDVLTHLGRHLIDVHSQHQTLELTERDFQLYVVDALAGNRQVLADYREVRENFLTSRKQLEALKNQREETFREQDYNEFLLEELDRARLEAGMQETLEARYASLNNAEQIIESLGNASQLFEDEQYGILSLQANLRQVVGKLSQYGPGFEKLYERIQSLYIEADDIAQELQQLMADQETDPGQLEVVSAQLKLLYDLQKKHGVSSVPELMEIREGLRAKVDQTGDLDREIEELQHELKDLERELEQLSATLHKNRGKALPRFARELEQQLSQLGMPNASFKMRMIPQEEFGPAGRESLELLFTANKGGKHGFLKKTASGGELSRIMLTIKSILASYESLPTMMFDEIDTGVSGEISTRMAEIMRTMSQHMQVFAITHLPQVASRGHQQFKVYKEDLQGRTYTRMKLLDPEQRLSELASMLGGTTASEAAISHARELLN